MPDISIGSGETIILASNLYSNSDDVWRHTASWGLSDTGGGMRIIEKDGDGNVISILAEKYWGTLNPDDAVGLPAGNPTSPSPSDEPDAYTDDSASDNAEPPEESTDDNTDDEVGLPAGSPTSPSPSDESVPNYSATTITISEFMPDPVGSEVRRTITR